MKTVPGFGKIHYLSKREAIGKSVTVLSNDTPVESWGDQSVGLPDRSVLRSIEIHTKSYTNYSLKQINDFLVGDEGSISFIPSSPPPLPPVVRSGVLLVSSGGSLLLGSGDSILLTTFAKK
jgi:hypothetical protein